VEKAIACCTQERAGWLAVRTPKFPHGDKEGAGKAAMTLAGFALELDRFGAALRFLTTVRKDLLPQYRQYTGDIVMNIDFVLAHIDDEEYETDLHQRKLQAWRAACDHTNPIRWVEGVATNVCVTHYVSSPRPRCLLASLQVPFSACEGSFQ
jgi:hypothetical protein